jgi:DNA-binding SARP family transcriptional activator
MEFAILGPLEVRRDGRLVALAGGRLRAVLAALLLHANQPVSAERLAQALWGVDAPPMATRTVQVYVSRLRKTLGEEELLATTPAGYRLRLAPGQLDAERFEQLVSEGRQALAQGRAEEAGAILRAALALWRGPPLADLEYAPFAQAEIARLEEHQMAALEARLDADLAAGRQAELVGELQQLAARYPLREHLQGQLMLALYRSQRQTEALAVYRSMRARLSAEVGLEPGPDLRRLESAILNHSAQLQHPELDSARHAAVAARDRAHSEQSRGGSPDRHRRVTETITRVQDSPFVGRAAEIERLAASWADVRAEQRRRLVLVSGEPGIGKTRLALHFADRATEDGGSVLYGRCSEEALAVYEPFAEAVGRWMRRASTQAMPALAAPLGELERLLGESSAEGSSELGARQRLFDGVDAAFTEIANAAPLLLVLDDLQWADRPTLLLLAVLMRSPRPAPMLVLGGYRGSPSPRSTPLTQALGELLRDDASERLELRGLPPDEVATVGEWWLGSRFARSTVDAVHARTRGNPLFVQELLRALAHDADAPVPESVREAIASRVGRLSADATSLLHVAAVLGDLIDPAILDAAAALPQDRAEVALDELLDAHLLAPAEASDRGLQFPHAVARQAIYVGLNPLRRSRLHRACAHALIAASDDRHVEQIAHHLSEASADDVGRAVEYLTRAGDRAMRMLGYEEAARFYARAADLSDRAASAVGGQPGHLRLAEGDALLRAGDLQAARGAFRSAAERARRTHDATLLAGAALGLSGLNVEIVDLNDERVQLLEEALRAVGDRDRVLRSRLLARLAVELYYAPSRDRSEELSLQAVVLARDSGDAYAHAAALNARRVAMWRPDRLDERLATADALIEAARATGERHLELQGRNWRVVDLFDLGDVDGWHAEARRHGALADELRLPAYAWYTPLWAAVRELHAGRFGEAAELRLRALAAGRRAGDANAELFSRMMSLIEAVLRGTIEKSELVDFVRQKIASSPASAAYRSGYAWMLTMLGHEREAHEQLAIVAADDYAALPFDVNWLSAIAECAEACVALDDATCAEPLYRRLRPYAGRPVTFGRAVGSYGAVDRHLGGLAATLGRIDDAIRHYRDAIRLNTEMDMRPWAVHARFGLAAVLIRGGAGTEAAALTAEARVEAKELGLDGLHTAGGDDPSTGRLPVN